MAGSSFGTLFRVTTWGESHGRGLGVVIDGCPAGLSLDKDDISPFMARRRPGKDFFTTARNESDFIEIYSGLFEGKTTGAPISMLLLNQDQISRDYTEIASYYRPNHADYTFDQKYGFRDYRGGGRSSGRETSARVAAGAVASKLLREFGIDVKAYVQRIGHISLPETVTECREEIRKNDILLSPLFMPDEETTKKAEELIIQMKEATDSVGGIVECVVTGLPAGLGEPVFDKLDASLGKAMFSIGAVKGVEIGTGFSATSLKGSENNDAFYIKDGLVAKKTNHSGGVLGGISDGDSLIIRVGFKPTPSIALPQDTVNKNKEEIRIRIKGRHDPCVVPRASVVVEAMTAITLADLLLQNAVSKMESLKKIYS